ncbi:MAG: hydroxyacid dehydrogenase [Lentisphaeria bacterium]|nr:hydroxyacid dehydrogenase [Lentisphaeria bacterium]
MPYDVFFFEAFEEERKELEHFLPDPIRAGFTAATTQEFGIGEAPPAPVISVRTQSLLPDHWAPRLAGILTRSTGYDHIHAYRTRTGADLPCGYLPLYCNRAVAEQAMMMWMALLRRLPRQCAHFSSFHRDGLTGGECAGKTLVVVGVGNIGKEIVDIGRGLRMNVLGVDPVHNLSGLHYMDIQEALPAADVLAVGMNLTAANRNFFGHDRLRALKQGAIFVNTARGELADAAALLDLLESGHLGGVGLDVYDEEPELAVSLREGRSPDSATVRAVLEMSARDDVVCTPHNAFNTLESVRRKSEQSIEQLNHLQRTGQFIWKVPQESDSPERCPESP